MVPSPRLRAEGYGGGPKGHGGEVIGIRMVPEHAIQTSGPETGKLYLLRSSIMQERLAVASK